MYIFEFGSFTGGWKPYRNIWSLL